jgi:lysophospholipase L1-like esterase
LSGTEEEGSHEDGWVFRWYNHLESINAEALVNSLLALALVPLLLTGDRAQGAFTLDDGDRVVFLGNTLIEREQRYGWWEYALTTRFAGKKIQFRNLGWSGDTVFGDARAGFGSRADGFRHLTEHTLSLKPTVIVIGYGTNESFEGPAGLADFTKGLNTLLDALAPTKARIVLLSPLRQGDMGRPLPDPAANNKNLRMYADRIREVAKKRGYRFIDLYDRLGDIGKVKPAVTDNGIHLNGVGYRWSARELESGLGIKDEGRRLPLGPRTVVFKDVTAGQHTLFIDKKAIATADAKEWAKGVSISSAPEFEQAEKLRKLIVAKNELYFHRWRPQNATYLFGFRKHEQGKNAREIPQFDPLIAAKEKEIAKLSVPAAFKYELKPAK